MSHTAGVAYDVSKPEPVQCKAFRDGSLLRLDCCGVEERVDAQLQSREKAATIGVLRAASVKSVVLASSLVSWSQRSLIGDEHRGVDGGGREVQSSNEEYYRG